MCDPISLLAAAGSVAAAGMNYASQQSTMKAQQQANDDWVSYQRQKARTADANDESMRQKSDAARNETLEKLTPEQQAAQQAETEGKLNSDMIAAGGGDQNIALLGAGANNEDPNSQNSQVTSALTDRVTSAAREARGRIKALASLTATTGGYNSLTDTANRGIVEGNQNIELQANKRKGNTAVLGTAQAVPVETFSAGDNILGSLASGLAGIGGSAFGAKMKG